MSDNHTIPALNTLAEAAVHEIHKAESIIVITHVSPDADAIGGLLGLTLALRSIGVNVTPASSDEIPLGLAILHGYNSITRVISRMPDLLIALDCGDLSRAGKLLDGSEWRNVRILNIDHHVTNSQFGNVNWVDPQASSTCELVLQLIDQFEIEPTADIATNLLYGIVGDTRGFRTQNTTSFTLECGVRLMNAGANLSEITERLFSQRAFTQLRLWANALDTMKLETVLSQNHARVIWTKMAKDARHKYGLSDASSSGLSNFLVDVAEADVSAVFVEKDNDDIDISLRAKRGFDVASVALSMGGGGHPLAAGLTIAGPLNDACELVVSALKDIERTE